jgi:hypothetical protein
VPFSFFILIKSKIKAIQKQNNIFFIFRKLESEKEKLELPIQIQYFSIQKTRNQL